MEFHCFFRIVSELVKAFLEWFTSRKYLFILFFLAALLFPGYLLVKIVILPACKARYFSEEMRPLPPDKHMKQMAGFPDSVRITQLLEYEKAFLQIRLCARYSPLLQCLDQ